MNGSKAVCRVHPLVPVTPTGAGCHACAADVAHRSDRRAARKAWRHSRSGDREAEWEQLARELDNRR